MATVFVERDTDASSPRFGKVKGVYRCAQLGTLVDAKLDENGNVLAPAYRLDDGLTTEELSDAHADVVEFFAFQAQPKVSGGEEMLARQRIEKLSALDAAIAKMPADIREPFAAIRELLQKE